MGRSGMLRALAGGTAFMILVAIAFTAAGGAAETDAEDDAQSECTVENAAQVPEPGKRLRRELRRQRRRPIQLQPDPNSQVRIINFGDDRQPESTTFSVTASRELPNGLERRLNLVADTMVRTGNENAESVRFPEPMFSELKTSGNRRRIRFDVCLSPPDNLPAGKYTGLITLDGPPGVESTAVTITANAKNGLMFWIGVGLTLILAFLVLLYKQAASIRAASMEAVEGERDPAKEAAAAEWRPAFRSAYRDIGWLATTLFALGATFGALYALWENNPAWGEAGFVTSLAALVGVGLAAVGARTVFTPTGGK